MIYYIYDATNNIKDCAEYDTFVSAKAAAESYRNQGITLEIYHITSDFETETDFSEEDF